MLAQGDRPSDVLDRALHAWREGEGPDEALSADARERIQEALAARRELPGPRSLFFPARRLLLAGGIPAGLILGLLAVLVPGYGPGPSPHSVTVAAAKQGDRIVFTLANGERAHVVYKSNVPNHFDRSSGVRVTGQFSDAVTSGPDVVYYKID